jgi:CheY-like chemotaxis protein
MRIEVRCTSCGQGFLVEEQATAGGLTCPACSAPMAKKMNAPPAPPAATMATSAASVAPAVTPAPEAEEVVCPRCQLHFVPQRSAAPTAKAGRRVVLVVEDMEFFRDIAREALAERYEVRTAATVLEAQAELSVGGIDLVLLDLTLDGGDHGIGLLRTMAAKPCPIVIYTDQDESEMYGDSWDELQSLGADDLVIKGMNVGESLVRKVASLLGEDENAAD